MELVHRSSTFRHRKMCRLCGYYASHEKDIFEKTPNVEDCIPGQSDLGDKIFRCVGIRVRRNDKLTTKICENCFDKIDEFIQFRELCAATDIELRFLLGLSNENDNSYAIYGDPDVARKDQDISAEKWCLSGTAIGRDADIILSDTKISFQVPPSLHQDEIHATILDGVTVKAEEHSGCEEDFVRETLQIKPKIESPSSANTIENDSQRSKTSDEAPVVCISSKTEDDTDPNIQHAGASGAGKRQQKSAARIKKRLKRIAIKTIRHSPVKCRSGGRCKETFKDWDAMEHHISTYHARGVKKTVICYLCKNHFSHKWNLAKHMVSIHIGPKSFQCAFPMCSMAFHQKGNLKKHVNTVHITANTFKCSKCPQIFYRKIHLKYHMANEHGTGALYRCHLCKAFFAHKKSLEIHIKEVHNGLKPFSCPFAKCLKDFARKYELKRHIEAIHEKKTAFKCTSCSFRTYYNGYLRLHMANMHREGSSVAASRLNQFETIATNTSAGSAIGCEESALDAPPDAKEHSDQNDNFEDNSNIATLTSAKMTDSQQSKTSDEAPVVCISLVTEDDTDSDVQFVENEDALTRNENSPAKTKKKALKSIRQYSVKCRSGERCKVMFRTWDAMEHHLLTYHARGVKKTVICYLCKKPFSRKMDLERHMISVHNGLKSFQCAFPMCSTAFKHKYHLDRHVIAIHATANTFKCSKCPQIFYRKFLLKHHLANEHGTGVLHRCHSCKRSFLHKNSLKKHVNTVHKGLKPFSCPFESCFMAFARKAYLQFHTKVVHEKKMAFKFKCTHCSFKTYYSRNLKIHMAIMHGEGSSHHETITVNVGDDCSAMGSSANYREERALNAPPGAKKHSDCQNDNLGDNSNIATLSSAKTTDSQQSKTSDEAPVVRISLVPVDESDSEVQFVETFGADRRDAKYIDKTKKTLKRKAIATKAQFSMKCRHGCKESFESPTAMEYHVSTFHRKGMKKTFVCHLCKRTFPFRLALENHLNSLHNGRRQFQCPFPMCPIVCSQRGNLKTHMNTVHANRNAFNCSKCPEIFYRKVLLKYHLQNEHGEGSLQRCQECNKTLTNKNSLRSHIDAVHRGVKPFPCRWASCSRAFANNACLKIHINAMHTKKIAFNCTKCAFKTYRKHNMGRHMANKHVEETSAART